MAEVFIQPDLCVFTHTHTQKNCCQACETHLVGLNRKMEIISFPVVHQNCGKPIFVLFFFVFFFPCRCLTWAEV